LTALRGGKRAFLVGELKNSRKKKKKDDPGFEKKEEK